MPELPDLTCYLEALERTVLGRRLQAVEIRNPFLLRSVDPPIEAAQGRAVRRLGRRGKRLVLCLDDDLALVIHLMIAGRLRWRVAGRKAPAGQPQAAFHFEHGVLYLTEAGSKRRASLHLVRGQEQLSQFDRGGLEVLDISPAEFAARLTQENHTLKRSLTDPRLFSGIGNAYSDEILHRARLSPLRLTSQLGPGEIARLHQACRAVLTEWIERLRTDTGDGFPEKVTAFRPGMAVHGRYGQPCPACGAPVQRIRYAEHETNYCARCQTEGRLLADRGLSRLLKEDWPRSLTALEDARGED